MSAETHPPISIEFIPALELIVAADSSALRTNASIKKEPVEPHSTASWRDAVESTVSPFELSDLDHVFAIESTALFLFHAVIRDGHHEIDDLLTALETASDDEFLNKFKWFLQIDPELEEWVHVETVETALENDRSRETIPFAEEARLLVRLLSSAGTFRRKIVSVLRWFYTEFFESNLQTARQTVERWIAEKGPMIETNPRETLNRLTNDEYDSLLAGRDAIRVFPVSDSEHGNFSMMLPDEAYVVISVAYAERVLAASSADASYAVTDASIEAFSDPKRIAILRQLTKRPYYGRELAEEIGISASTASYHIEKLVAAHLVQVQLSSGRRFYYAINPNGIRTFIKRLETEFLAET